MTRHEAIQLLQSDCGLTREETRRLLLLAENDSTLRNDLIKRLEYDASLAAHLGELPLSAELQTDLKATPPVLDFDAEDLAFARALAEVEPPASLKALILEATPSDPSKVTSFPPKTEASKTKSLQPFVLGIAAALALLLTISFLKRSSPSTSPELISTAAVEAKVRSLFEGDYSLSLDLLNPRQSELFAYLQENGLPRPEVLPPGLSAADGVGCKEIEIEGRAATLICFQPVEGEALVHLIVMERNSLAENPPPTGLAEAAKNSQAIEGFAGWSMTHWSDEERAFYLTSQREPQELAALF